MRYNIFDVKSKYCAGENNGKTERKRKLSEGCGLPGHFSIAQ